MKNMYTKIREWADARGIYESGDAKTQFIKLTEETGELAVSILKRDRAEFEDAIGDAVVVLTNLAELGNKYFDTSEDDQITIEKCIEDAYKVIENRTGSMRNGTFKKA